MEDERKEMKLYGIVEAVVETIKNKTIDIHHVFTKQYAQKFVDVDDLDSRYQVVKDWIDSLPYILSIDEDNRVNVFGSVKLADMEHYVDGAEVACFVVKNICADFCIDGEIFLHPVMMNRGIVPKILFTPEAFWDGWKVNFLYYADGYDYPIQFFATSNLIADDLNLDDPNQGNDLMRLEEVFQCYKDKNHNPIEHEDNEQTESDEDATYTEPLGIYGFMASLINAVFVDAIRRRIFNVNWYNWACFVPCTAPHMKLIINELLPEKLHVPGVYVFEVYMQKALPALHQKLEFDDIEFEPEIAYTMRKMLEIEVEQSKIFDKSKLWEAFPIKVQKMLRQYHNLFIKWLRKNVGEEEPKEPMNTENLPEKQTDENTPASYESDGLELFKYIHYTITDEQERLIIHKFVCNIVRLPKMQQICDALAELMRSKKILSSIDQSAMLAELHRLGMPADQKGFSDQNFYSYYKTK